ncbi:alpha/beta-hydrolase [Punctularia strigosozonata HHB-11173 SS5]|uniref:alpha/beta-hydrolase n=1 Tax=Punctularia strigosozonata (strain HHB-11173) TaxID=741275 RepID=UPI0004417A72|nr:alpha/beta-hydrolase [Punctularia strigosozonata HHB-11173 SS5]EIN12339.1 alpha/beta-hydrolase [Punctularia strigosozonata HHB-11173 SS5]
MTERPFTVAVPDVQLDHLIQKLDFARLPDELDEAGWDYGAPLADVKRLVDRWRNGWDWRRFEAEINQLPMFTRDIDVDGFGALNIHYVHQKSETASAVPLLFVHGWPGHFLEVRKILPLLVSKGQPSFNVVAFSLPGYGWSEAPKKKGFGLAQYAEVGHKLMLALGYTEYVTQGGDWGYLITRKMATLYGGRHIKAWHTNMPVGAPPKLRSSPLTFLRTLLGLTAAEKAGLARMKWFHTKGQGYMQEQSTQPQTLGYSLADSPVGLLAWIYEKLHDWTDSYPWNDDEVLDWVSVYWFSRAGPTASLRIYYEVIQAGDFIWRDRVTSAPMGVSYFPKEIMPAPPSWVRLTGRVIFEARHDAGGHFAAYEKPEELVGDLKKMFGKGGPAFGIISGKNGYSQEAKTIAKC